MAEAALRPDSVRANPEPASTDSFRHNPYFRSYRAPVLAEIEAYLSRTGSLPTRLGLLAIGDGNIVDDLRAGRDPKSKTVAILQAFMAKHEGGC